MKKTITATLVHETANQRFYKLSHPITKGFQAFKSGDKDILAELELEKKYLKPEYSTLYDGLTGIDIVCISDANTHTERLVFAATERKIIGYGRTRVQIDGAFTIMAYGGDSRSVKPDGVYLRRLASLNGFNYSQSSNPELTDKLI